MKDIKVIETIYKGYKFRSRLEARWAVFFDEIGVSWEYEKEGYDLDGVWYLPDFWVIDWDCFVEIKGDPMQLKDGLEKIKKLSKMIEKDCFILYGSPDHELYQMIYPPVEIDGEIHQGIENPNKIMQCRRCTSFWYAVEDGGSYGNINRCDPGCNSDRFPFLSDKLLNAHNKAKSYRF